MSLNRPLGRFIHRVAMSFCLFACLPVCLGPSKTPTSGGRGDLWSKNVFQIIIIMTHFKDKKRASYFSPKKKLDWPPPLFGLFGIDASIRIGWEIQCLLYDRFLEKYKSKTELVNIQSRNFKIKWEPHKMPFMSFNT